MKVYVNDIEVVLHRGMTVKHALSLSQLSAVRSGKMEVTDREGNVVGLEGSLDEGSRLYTKKKESAASKADSL